MTVRHRIVCDACQSDKLFGTAHFSLSPQPTFPGATRTLHFCDPTCLQRHLGNLQGVYDAHKRAWAAHLAARRATS